MKALVGAFNQEKALVGAFSVIVQPVVELMEHYTALPVMPVVLKKIVLEVSSVREFPKLKPKLQRENNIITENVIHIILAVHWN